MRACNAIAIVLAVLITVGSTACRVGDEELEVAADIQARRQQLVPTILEASLDHLSEGDKKALDHLVQAAKIMDEIFLIQAWTGNPVFAQQVAGLTGPDARAAQDYYRIMFGPWDRLAGFEPFLGSTPRLPGAGYYPEDMTREEFEAHLAEHPGDQEAFTSTFSVIRRVDGRLVAVPYSQEYRPWLERTAAKLRAAAEATDNESLRRFLSLRADAFFTDDYFESDIAWMDLDSPIEVVIGPYETYEDDLFGYKAAFQAFVCIEQPVESARLALYKDQLPFLERNLPIPDRHKNLDRGSESPIRVVDEVFTGGDTKAGVQTLAFNLPNDERVREAKGSKNVLLKNMMHAKYDAILLPIAERVLPAGEEGKVDFESYFHFILFHELAHGLGPGRITVEGRSTEVRLELRDLYSAIEETKADSLGIHNLYVLADRGVVPAEVAAPLPWTVTAGLFRSARFGTTSAHGLGVVIQTNWLIEKGALEVTPDGRFRPDAERFPGAVAGLVEELLMIQALGSYEGAQALVEKYGTVRPEMQAALDSLRAVPVDVEPVYAYTGGW